MDCPHFQDGSPPTCQLIDRATSIDICRLCKMEWRNGPAPTAESMTHILRRRSGLPSERMRPAPPASRRPPCLHLGPVVDRLGVLCQSKWVRACDVKGTTTLNGCWRCPEYEADSPHVGARSMLIRFPHGLGDTAQLTTVLEYLRRLRPDIGRIDFEGKIGTHTALKRYVDNFYLTDRGERAPRGYDWDCFIPWFEPNESYVGIPSTKAEKSLREQFGIQPVADLCRYFIDVGDEARAAARDYLSSIAPEGPDGRFPVVILHFLGNTSKGFKDLSNETVEILLDVINASNHKAVLLDWHRASPLADERRAFCPDVTHPLWQATGTGDAERIAALAESAALFVGIDSGPLHCAMGSAKARIIGVWTGHHPIHYAGIHDNAVHLVPEGHELLIRGDRATGLAAFNELYRHRVYQWIDDGLVSEVASRLTFERRGDLARVAGYWCRFENLAQDLIVVRDVDRQDSYRLASLGIEPRPELVLDIGAHIGTFAATYHRLNPLARIVCVEACPENLPALEANVGQFATIVHAACTYEHGELGLLNAVSPHCGSTGGSRVVPREKVAGGGVEGEYWRDARPLEKVTVEELVARYGGGLSDVAVLKLDCEGSEFSILPNMTTPVRTILGEYHGRKKWDRLVQQHFKDWPREQKDGPNSGTFRLRQPE